MPRLNAGLQVTMGTSSSSGLSYDGQVLYWNATASLPALINQPIIASRSAWVNRWTIVFESCQSGTCRVYTYDIPTSQITQVSTTGADALYADGGVWAKWVNGVGYEDSIGRSHATYGVAGVDTNGTVLVILNRAEMFGLGYLSKQTASANNVMVICYDALQHEIPASIRSGVVIYHANDVLHRYVLTTDKFSSSNVPVLLAQNDGDWVVASSTLGWGEVVFNFTESSAWSLGPANVNYAPDIRLTRNNQQLNIVTSTYQEEFPTSIQRYSFYIPTLEQARPRSNLYAHSLAGRPIISATTTPVDYGVRLRGSDIITVREDTRYIINNITNQFDGVETEFSLLSGTTPVTPGSAQNLLVSLGGVIQEPEVVYSVSGSTITFTSPPVASQDFFAVLLSAAVTANTATRGFAQVISSAEWFGTSGGDDLRAAWQYNTTAVVASTDATGNTNVTVKDSEGNTWAAGEAAYGTSAVIIRPSPTSTTITPLWEVSWVRNATTYARVTLDATLVNTTPITQNTDITFAASGILDIDETTTHPIPAAAYEGNWYGYVRLQYPTTRGAWTLGKDVSPWCPPEIHRWIAWNSDTERAYVVWNANRNYTIPTAPAHLALEYQTGDRVVAAAIPPLQTTLIREHQWQLLTEDDIQFGRAPGTT